MNETRREFLGGGLIACGALGAGLVAAKMVRRLQPSEKPAALVPALTPTGEVIHVHAHGQASGGEAHAMHAPAAATNAEARRGVTGRKWVMVIDLAKCDGCKACTEACQKAHFTPPEREWIRVFKMQEAEHTAPYFFPKACFHCDNPPCTRVCPVGATFKRQDGIVLIDNERCIGCRFCIAACPYSTRYFNWGRPDNAGATQAKYSPETGVPRRMGTVEKCDFCPEMLAAGELPHCASGCAMGAIYFGDQNEDTVTNSKGETERLSKLLKDRAGYRFMEELGTEPRAFYLPPKNRMYAAPGEEKHT